MASGLLAYLDSVKARDPAPHSRWEVLLYPGAWALAGCGSEINSTTGAGAVTVEELQERPHAGLVREPVGL